MPIPPLDTSGFLPPGIHPCSLDEFEEMFVRRFESMHRQTQFMDLKMYVQRVRGFDKAQSIILDGSYVTRDPSPSDIDLILILKKDADLGATLERSHYGVISARQVRNHYSALDIFVVQDGSNELNDYISRFQEVKYRPGMKKGLLRVDL